jgi:hypothetical protein
MRVEQIAQVMRKTKTHVKVMLFRARESLGGKLQQAAKDEARPKPHEANGAEKKATPAMRVGGGESSNRVGAVVM